MITRTRESSSFVVQRRGDENANFLLLFARLSEMILRTLTLRRANGISMEMERGIRSEVSREKPGKRNDIVNSRCLSTEDRENAQQSFIRGSKHSSSPN